MARKEGVPVDRGREIEAALIVYADAPQAAGQRLAGLQALAEFSPLPRAARAIEDIYFDTADRSLQARLIALRVRRLDGTTLVTMKADSHRTAAGEDRLEIESPWSSSALHDIVSELRSRGAGVPGSPGELGSADPTAVVASLGLEQVQTRVTTRTPRDLVARGAESEPLAELAIDAVTYRFREGRIRLVEVEVEAKGGGDACTVERITASLREEFPSQVRPWPYGKLPTGQAIQELLADGRLDGLTGQDGMLRPQACEQVAEVLNCSAMSQPRQRQDDCLTLHGSESADSPESLAADSSLLPVAIPQAALRAGPACHRRPDPRPARPAGSARAPRTVTGTAGRAFRDGPDGYDASPIAATVPCASAKRTPRGTHKGHHCQEGVRI